MRLNSALAEVGLDGRIQFALGQGVAAIPSHELGANFGSDSGNDFGGRAAAQHQLDPALVKGRTEGDQ